jgi:hypothetical protein
VLGFDSRPKREYGFGIPFFSRSGKGPPGGREPGDGNAVGLFLLAPLQCSLARTRLPNATRSIRMSLNDAWLDKLAEKQEKLERELQEINARLQTLGSPAGKIGPDEARRQAENSPDLRERLRKLEEEAAEAGRARAEQARRELDAARDGSPSGAGIRRRGVVRL